MGIGCTEYSKDSGVSVFSLATDAIKAAIADAGLAIGDIDGLGTYGTNDSVAPNILGQALGVKSLSFYVDQYYGGSTSMTMLGQATLALAAGVADCIVVYRALNGRSPSPAQRIDCGQRCPPLGHAVQVRGGLRGAVEGVSRWRPGRTC